MPEGNDKNLVELLKATKDGVPGPALAALSAWCGPYAKEFGEPFQFWAGLITTLGLWLGLIIFGVIAIKGAYDALTKRIEPAA